MKSKDPPDEKVSHAHHEDDIDEDTESHRPQVLYQAWRHFNEPSHQRVCLKLHKRNEENDEDDEIEKLKTDESWNCSHGSKHRFGDQNIFIEQFLLRDDEIGAKKDKKCEYKQSYYAKESEETSSCQNNLEYIEIEQNSTFSGQKKSVQEVGDHRYKYRPCKKKIDEPEVKIKLIVFSDVPETTYQISDHAAAPPLFIFHSEPTFRSYTFILIINTNQQKKPLKRTHR